MAPSLVTSESSIDQTYLAPSAVVAYLWAGGTVILLQNDTEAVLLPTGDARISIQLMCNNWPFAQAGWVTCSPDLLTTWFSSILPPPLYPIPVSPYRTYLAPLLSPPHTPFPLPLPPSPRTCGEVACCREILTCVADCVTLVGILLWTGTHARRGAGNNAEG